MTPPGDRLAVVGDHPDYAAAMRHTPASRLGHLFAIGALLVPAGLSVALAFSAIVGVPLVLSGALLLAALIYLRRAPLEKFAAQVVDQRGEGDAPTPDPRYLVLANRDGTTREYRAADHLRVLAPGDVGIAYTRLGFLLEFRKLG